MLRLKRFGGISTKVSWGIIAIVCLLLVASLVMSACDDSPSTATPTPTSTPAETASPTPDNDAQPSGPISAEWIEPVVDVENVSIPVSEVEDNWNIHFGIETDDDDINFMAYKLDGEIYVRANVCPPCRSIGYALDGDNLVCDRCATIFDAETGDGVSGACMEFPKALVAYNIEDGNIAMSKSDLIEAYDATLLRGWP